MRVDSAWGYQSRNGRYKLMEEKSAYWVLTVRAARFASFFPRMPLPRADPSRRPLGSGLVLVQFAVQLLEYLRSPGAVQFAFQATQSVANDVAVMQLRTQLLF